MTKPSKGSKLVYTVLASIFIFGLTHYLWDKAVSILREMFLPKPNPAADIITRFCTLPPPTSVASVNGVNNPLGIKLSPFVKTLGGTYSGIAAKDGGTFARFATPQQCFNAGKETFRRADNYHEDTSIDQALLIWSNHGYDGKILAGTDIDPEEGVRSLDDAQMDILLRAISKREGVDPTASAVIVPDEDDHSLESVTEFDVHVHAYRDSMGDCWRYHGVRVPNFWNHPGGVWSVYFSMPVRNQKVWFWYWGKVMPQGPYSEADLLHPYLPGFSNPPIADPQRGPYAEWRVWGTEGSVLHYAKIS